MISGKDLKDWGRSGRDLGRIWEGSGKNLGRIWEGSGEKSDLIWEGSGKNLGDSGYDFGFPPPAALLGASWDRFLGPLDQRISGGGSRLCNPPAIPRATPSKFATNSSQLWSLRELQRTPSNYYHYYY